MERGTPMFNVATIVPKAHLNELKHDKYFMCLSMAARDTEYFNFFARRAAEGRFVIMDNSAVELGYPQPFPEYYELAERMGVSEIMLPDIFQDAEATITAAEDALAWLRTVSPHWAGHIMGIPQGKTQLEWMQCAANLKKFREITTIGISYRYDELWNGRENATYLFGNDVFIHYLGCKADPLIDVFPVLRAGRVRSVDSAGPSIYAKHGMEWNPNVPRPKRDVDFLTDNYDTELLKRNIGRYIARCNGLAQYE